MENDLIKRGMVFDETVDVFRHVEHYHHDNEQTDGKEECANEFSKNIPVYFSHCVDIQYLRYSIHHFWKHHVAPLGEVALYDMFSGLFHQPQVETEVVHRGDHRAENLF